MSSSLESPTPGAIAYEAYYTALAGGICHCLPLTWQATPLAQQHAWEAAALAVLEADSEGLNSARISFRYAIGAVLRLAGSPCPWTVRGRRWVEREVMPPYAEYHVVAAPEDLRCWMVEADLEPWEEEAPPATMPVPPGALMH